MWGIDPASGKLILDAAASGHEATEGRNAGADLYKVLTSETVSSNAISQARQVYEALGYKEWAILETLESWALGKIVGFNESTKGMYTWDRYPIYVKLPTGNVFEYSLLSTDYDEVPWYVWNPQQLMTDYGDKMQWQVVKELSNADEIMQKQKILYEMTRDEVLNFIDTTYPVIPIEKDYVYRYAVFKIEQWLFKNIKKTQELASFIESEQFHNIQNPAIKELILTTYFDHLAREYTYDDETRYGESLSVLIALYGMMTDAEYKAKVKTIILSRVQKMEGNEFYDFVTATKGTDLEEIAFAELEKRTQ